MKAINCRLVSVAEYLMNVCMMRRNYQENLGKIVKSILKNEGFYGKKAIDEQLCTKRRQKAELSFIDVHRETKVRLECYMATSTSGITTNGRSKPRS